MNVQDVQLSRRPTVAEGGTPIGRTAPSLDDGCQHVVPYRGFLNNPTLPSVAAVSPIGLCAVVGADFELFFSFF